MVAQSGGTGQFQDFPGQSELITKKLPSKMLKNRFIESYCHFSQSKQRSDRSLSKPTKMKQKFPLEEKKSNESISSLSRDYSKSLDKLDKENHPDKKMKSKSESRESLAPTNGFGRHLQRHSYYVRDLHTKSLLSSKTILVDMFVAASCGNVKLVDFYVRVGQLPIDAADNRGWRAIHHASLHAQTDVVEMLVQKGASINCSTVSGLTPLLLAGSALTPRYNVIKLLIHKGAKLNVKSPQGTTVLMDVAGRAFEPETGDLCHLLLKYGADFRESDQKGRTAIDYAASVNNYDVIKTIQSFQAKRTRSPKN